MDLEIPIKNISASLYIGYGVPREIIKIYHISTEDVQILLPRASTLLFCAHLQPTFCSHYCWVTQGLISPLRLEKKTAFKEINTSLLL